MSALPVLAPAPVPWPDPKTHTPAEAARVVELYHALLRGEIRPSIPGFGEIEPGDWRPEVPGPQSHNAGITPGYRRPRMGKWGRRLARDVHRAVAALEDDLAATLTLVLARLEAIERRTRGSA